MKLVQQVCSLEFAQKLKELGVKQDGLFNWLRFNDGHHELVYGNVPKGNSYWTSAFTVAELGEMLPLGIAYEHTTEDKRWRCGLIKQLGTDDISSWNWGDTEADARAKMLIYLLENKLINDTRSHHYPYRSRLTLIWKIKTVAREH